MNRAYTGAIGRGRAAQTDLAATGRIADALSVPLMTLLIESTLNVGSDSGLSTVELGDRSRAWPPVTLDVTASGDQRPLTSPRPRQFL